MPERTQERLAEEAVRLGWISREQLDGLLAERTSKGLLVRLTERGWLTLDQVGDLFVSVGFIETAPPQTADSLDQAFGHYVLVQELSRGSVGIVYKAWDILALKFVALKVMRGHSAEEMLRFIREAQAYSRLKHPNIAAVYESGEVHGDAFLAMELVEGVPLSADQPIRRTLECMRDAARALHYAHGQGVIHRDLKPGNILLDRSGRVVVTDFGLAKISMADTRVLSPASMIGTPGYMSPEQLRGGHADARTDVYGLGATLYALVTGEPPHRADSMPELAESVVRREPASPGKLNPRVNADLERVILTALAKDPTRRFATAEDFARALDRLL